MDYLKTLDAGQLQARAPWLVMQPRCSLACHVTPLLLCSALLRAMLALMQSSWQAAMVLAGRAAGRHVKQGPIRGRQIPRGVGQLSSSPCACPCCLQELTGRAGEDVLEAMNTFIQRLMGE